MNPEQHDSPRSVAELINRAAAVHGWRSYCEIGCRHDETFRAVLLPDKTGVDPHSGGTLRITSDEFFRVNRKGFDCVFIDGLHRAEQVRRDVRNALETLNAGGLIFVHDCLPKKEIHQIVPPDPFAAWTGDVWKAFVEIRADRTLQSCVWDRLWGVGVIRKAHNQRPVQLPDRLDWRYYCEHGAEALDVVDWLVFWPFVQRKEGGDNSRVNPSLVP